MTSTTTFSALEHGAPASEYLQIASETSPAVWGKTAFATPSLTAYINRRLSFAKRASVNFTKAEKTAESFRLLLESAFHFGFVLAMVLIIATPVHIFYFPGNYCNFYWSNTCTNGMPLLLNVFRAICTVAASLYTSKHYLVRIHLYSQIDVFIHSCYLQPMSFTAGYFWYFLRAFKVSDGFVRIVILTFLFLFFLPVTALVDGIVCLMSYFAVFTPAKFSRALSKDVPIVSPSAVA